MLEGLTQVMLDLETMSTASNACICSIGAVKFDTEKGITSKFYVTVDARDCKRLGLDFSASTLAWWKKQNRKALDMLLEDNMPLQEALIKFSAWYGKKSLWTWGCGSDFDNVIMKNAYDAVGMKLPWKYGDNRCYRTMRALFPEIEGGERVGTYHNALDDARYQAKHLIRILG
jgi:hypothetical protein